MHEPGVTPKVCMLIRGYTAIERWQSQSVFCTRYGRDGVHVASWRGGYHVLPFVDMEQYALAQELRIDSRLA